jgi:hypothetical protein
MEEPRPDDVLAAAAERFAYATQELRRRQSTLRELADRKRDAAAAVDEAIEELKSARAALLALKVQP